MAAAEQRCLGAARQRGVGAEGALGRGSGSAKIRRLGGHCRTARLAMPPQRPLTAWAVSLVSSRQKRERGAIVDDFQFALNIVLDVIFAISSHVHRVPIGQFLENLTECVSSSASAQNCLALASVAALGRPLVDTTASANTVCRQCPTNVRRCPCQSHFKTVFVFPDSCSCRQTEPVSKFSLWVRVMRHCSPGGASCQMKKHVNSYVFINWTAMRILPWERIF